MNCLRSLVALESEQLASALYGIAAFNTCPPAPNPSIERTCLKPLRAFSPTAHVER